MQSLDLNHNPTVSFIICTCYRTILKKGRSAVKIFWSNCCAEDVLHRDTHGRIVDLLLCPRPYHDPRYSFLSLLVMDGISILCKQLNKRTYQDHLHDNQVNSYFKEEIGTTSSRLVEYTIKLLLFKLKVVASRKKRELDVSFIHHLSITLFFNTHQRRE